MKAKTILSILLVIGFSFSLKTNQNKTQPDIKETESLPIKGNRNNFTIDSLKEIAINKMENLNKERITYTKLSAEKRQILLELKTEIETATENIKKDKLDSFCIEKRGFIGRKILGKDQCKKWKIRGEN